MKEYTLNGTRAPGMIQAIFLSQGELGSLGIVLSNSNIEYGCILLLVVAVAFQKKEQGSLVQLLQMNTQVRIAATHLAFAAVYGDGSVTCWGDYHSGGKVPEECPGLETGQLGS